MPLFDSSPFAQRLAIGANSKLQLPSGLRLPGAAGPVVSNDGRLAQGFPASPLARKPVTARASTVAVAAMRFPAAESSLRVRTRLDTVEPAGMALLSSWRKLSLSGWPKTTDPGKSPAGTSGVGTPEGGATGPVGPFTEPPCSCQYQEPPVTGTPADVWAGASAGKATDVRSTAATTRSPSRLTFRPLRATSAATEREYCPLLSGCLQGRLSCSDVPGGARVKQVAQVAG